MDNIEVNYYDKFLKWFAASPIASWLRVFVAIVLGQIITEWTKTGTFTFSNWQQWLMAGVVALIPMVIRWLNPQDTAFGKVK